MRKVFISVVAVLCLLTATSCGKKKQTDTIITKKQVEKKVEATPQTTGDYDQSREVEWAGGVYQVAVSRTSDESLPVVDDGTGIKYYDNRINVKVTRQDGSEFFNRTFTKNDFAHLVEKEYREHSVLLGVVFDKADGDNLLFAASIGSPDRLSDEYVPMIVTLSRTGSVSMKKGALLDEDNAPVVNHETQEAEDDGV